MVQDLPLEHGKQGAWPVTKQKQTNKQIRRSTSIRWCINTKNSLYRTLILHHQWQVQTFRLGGPGHPDPEIRGGGAVLRKFFLALQAPPPDTPLIILMTSLCCRQLTKSQGS